MPSNLKYFREDVLVDGQKFTNCLFVESRIIYRATAPVQFDQCTFTTCEWVFGGPAENMLFYLAALATNLGEDARTMVLNLLNGIASGQLDNVMTQSHPPVAV
jgi:hypothetical protein